MVLDCASPGALGLENGNIEDSQILKSTAKENYLKNYGRLNFENGVHSGWLHDVNDNDPWFGINFIKDALVSGVATQGGAHNSDMWMETFEMSYSVDEINFAFYTFANKTKVQ